jgi:DNA-binding CsgD family transcriptional regulator
LPCTGDVVEWITEFRQALIVLLGDVDHISLNINRSCDLENPETYRPDLTITEHVSTAPGSDGSVVVESTDEPPAIRLLHSFKKQGQQLDQFHPPVYFDYYYKGSAYLCSMFLWRYTDKSPISEKTIELIRELEPFLNFAFSDIVARNQQARPIDGVFREAVNRMATEGDLSSQERKIAYLRLLGHSYKEMADLASIAIDTVKKHVTQVHRKTRTRSQSELFAKYFTNRYAIGVIDDEEP